MRLQFKHISEYEASLGAGGAEAMQKHEALTDGVEKNIIANGSDLKKSVNFSLVSQTATEILQQKRLDIKGLWWQHVEITYYLKMPGHNGEIQPGHVREDWRGLDGVWMPDAPITKVNLTESMQANLRRKLSAPGPGSSHE